MGKVRSYAILDQLDESTSFHVALIDQIRRCLNGDGLLEQYGSNSPQWIEVSRILGPAGIVEGLDRRMFAATPVQELYTSFF